MAALVLAAALFVAFVNGANDNMKGVATLLGSGVLSYRRALALATASTALGALVSVFLATSLIRAFSGKGLVPDASLTPTFLAAVAVAAALTILAATRLGFPVSTTHALVGGLGGAGWIAAGPDLDIGALATAFALPLALGPLLGIVLAWSGHRAGRSGGRWLGIDSKSCICIDRQWVPSWLASRSGKGAAGATTAVPAGFSVTVGEAKDCRAASPAAGVSIDVASALSIGHIASASAVGFARGLNDTPKILGLVAISPLLPLPAAALAVALAMSAGGLLAARRVAHTMAERITPMSPSEGLTANLATSLLVIAASRLSLPVSTTHVSTGSIFGIGAAGGGLRWATASGIVAAWVTTLPLAAGLAALMMKALA